MYNQQLSKISHKGEPILLIGGSSSGKTTWICSLNHNEIVMMILMKRIGNSKTTTQLTRIVFSDYLSEEDKDVVYNKRKLPDVNQLDVFDDNDLMIKILQKSIFDFFNEYGADTNEYGKKIYEAIETNIKIEIANATNNKLEYRLKEVEPSLIKAIVNKLANLDMNTAYLMYYETKNRSKNSSSAKKFTDHFKEVFEEVYKGNSDFKLLVDDTWKIIVDSINGVVKKMVSDINTYNGDVNRLGPITSLNSQDRDFILRVTKDDIGKSDIIDDILDSGVKSKEVYIKDLSIIARMEPEWFDNKNTSYAVFEENGKTYHQLVLNDTMGLFHDSDASMVDEYNRMIETCKISHCSNLIFTLDATMSGTSDDSFRVLNRFLESSPRQINVNLVFTHFDNLISKCIYVNPLLPANTDVEGAIKKAKYQIECFLDQCKSSLNRNKNSKRPTLSSFVSICSNPIESKPEYLYINSSKATLDEINSNYNNTKFKVEHTDFSKFTPALINISRNEPYKVSNLFDNLIQCLWYTTAGDFNIMWTTIKAILIKWLYSGNEHISEARGKETVFSYAKVDSLFVREMRHFVDESVRKNLIIVSDKWLKAGDKNTFNDFAKNTIIGYMAYEFPKEVAKKIYGIKVFNYSMGKMLLNQILNDLENNYFNDKNVIINDNVYECLQIALKTSIQSFVDNYCIEVY